MLDPVLSNVESNSRYLESIALRRDAPGTSRRCVRTFSHHQPIFHEGDRADYFYEIVSGVVKLSKLLADGRSLITGFFVPGDLIGVAVGETYICSAYALGETKLRPIATTRIADPASWSASCETLFRTVCRQYEAAIEQLLNLGLKDPREKVASFLVSFFERQRRAEINPMSEGRTLRLPMSRREIAEHLGLTPETVCRVFAKFRAAGLIATNSCAEIELTDFAALEDLADGAG